MDEKSHERTAGFAVMCGKLAHFAEHLVLFAQSELPVRRAAAE
jgi:hypothetical protein